MSFFVECPHCHGSIEILEINCAIFRHAIFKQTGVQLHPHASKEECELLLSQNVLLGCGKPFRLQQRSDQIYEAIICDYI